VRVGRPSSRKKIVPPALIVGGLLVALIGLIKPAFFWESGKFQRWMAESGSEWMGRYFMILGGIMIAIGVVVLVVSKRRDP
jgi:hypothetical protein